MEAIYWSLSIGIVLCLIAPQLLRERLVQKLRHTRPDLSSEVSDWFFGQSGYASAIKMQFAWGKRASELSAIEGVAKYIWLLRTIDVAKLVLVLVGGAMLIVELGPFA